MAEETFTVHFNKRKSFFIVHLHDVHPDTFARKKGGRWGYFLQADGAGSVGYFGDVHFVASRLRQSLISHELEHLRAAWYWEVLGETLTRKNEERFIAFLDVLTDNFYRAYEKAV